MDYVGLDIAATSPRKRVAVVVTEQEEEEEEEDFSAPPPSDDEQDDLPPPPPLLDDVLQHQRTISTTHNHSSSSSSSNVPKSPPPRFTAKHTIGIITRPVDGFDGDSDHHSIAESPDTVAFSPVHEAPTAWRTRFLNGHLKVPPPPYFSDDDDDDDDDDTEQGSGIAVMTPKIRRSRKGRAPMSPLPQRSSTSSKHIRFSFRKGNNVL